MSSGIRAEVRIDAPSECPVAQVSAATGASSYSISKSVDPNAPGRVTEEFMLDDEVDAEGIDLECDDLSEVFSYGSKHVYRFSRAGGQGCPCERIEQFDCPVVDAHTEDGALYLTFHAPDVDRLGEVVGALREAYPGVDVRRLLRSGEEEAANDLVFVDRGSLTDRQREVLRTAHEMGYFEHPKGANAGQVADALDITTSTFTEHLASVQRKLLGAVVDD